MVTKAKYTLPSEIAAELAALPDPKVSGFLDRLQCVPIEVVVIARRQAIGRTLRDQIERILVERSARLISKAVERHSRVPPDEFEDVEAEAMALFWKKIQSESFFEIRFNSAMKSLAEQAGRKICGSNQWARERFAIRLGSEDDEKSDGNSFIADIPDDSNEYAQFERRFLIDVELASLPNDQARAIILHYRFGLQIFSKHPEVQSVASELGCGERKARKLVSEGKAALRHSIGQEEGDEAWKPRPSGA